MKTLLKLCYALITGYVVIVLFSPTREDKPKSHFRTIETQECEHDYENEPVDVYDSIYRIQSKRFKR